MQKEKGKRKSRTCGDLFLRGHVPLPFSFLLLPSRRAHTLTELLLVLTILSMFAVIALPRFLSAMFRTRIDAALEAARSDLALTRARAVATGLRHQFYLDTSTREIVVEPFRPDEQAAGTAVVAQQAPGTVLRDRLPEAVEVAEWSVFPMGYETQAGSAPRGQGVEDLPVTFYPEGRGDSARLILRDSENNREGLYLDGFTGEIRELTPEELQ